MSARWALLGQDGDEFSEFAADILKKRSPYEVSRHNGNIYFRTSFEDKASERLIQLSPRITKRNYRNKANYRLLIHKHPLYKQHLGGFSLSESQIAKIKENIDKRDGFYRFDWLSRYVLYASRDQIESTLSDILLPSFFDWYPEGTVYVSTIDASLNARLTALRVLGAIDRLGGRKVESKGKFVNFLGLENVQPSGVTKPSKYLAIPLYLSLPKPVGFLASRMVDTIVFLFGNPLSEIRGIFPRSGIEFFRSEASLLLHEDKRIANQKGELSLDLGEIDSFGLINKEFTQDAWWGFVKQYAGHLNKFFIYLTDPSNFVKDNDEWANLTHYFIWLSFERLCDETILLLTEENQYLRKMAFFRILDQLAFLKHPDQRSQVSMFGELLLPATDPDLIKNGLSRYKGEVAEYLLSELTSIRQILKKTIIDSVMLNDMNDDERMVIRLPSGERVAYDDYVRKTVRAIRNTAHGYSTDRYLMTNRGNLPDNISLLAILALLAFIAEPKNFLRQTWDE